jgi:diguanylate cyclase (GGDEF)-like protein/PAS domain S-box-containing protein
METSCSGENYFIDHKCACSSELSVKGEKSKLSSQISKQFELILDALPFYVLLVDSNHRILYANAMFRRSYDVSLDAVQGIYCPQFVHKCDHFEGCAVEQARNGGSFEKVFFKPDINRWLLTTAYLTGAKTDNGLDIYYHTVRDITDEQMIRQALVESENRYRRIFEEMKDTIFQISSEGLLLDMNPAGLDLLQIQPFKIGKINFFTDLNLNTDKCNAFVDHLKKYGEINDYEVTYTRPDGKVLTGSINANMEIDDQGKGIIRGIIRDLTHNRELEMLSSIDNLTGMYNKGFFQTFLLNRIRTLCPGQDISLSLLFCDIDNFKSYNDTFGHPEGDYALKKVADAIRSGLRIEDFAARYGGEEFTAIMTCNRAIAVQIAERVRKIVEENCSNFADIRIKRNLTLSIGIATLGIDADSAEKLVNIADQRMYEAKKRGKNQVYAGK